LDARPWCDDDLSREYVRQPFPCIRACTSACRSDTDRKYCVGHGVMSSTSASVALGGDSTRRLVADSDPFDVESPLAPVSVPIGGTVAFGAFIASCCGVIRCADAAVAVARAGAAASRAKTKN
jgi:hypothetical protein